MAQSRRFRAGDVFRLMPFGDGSHGYGQILAAYGGTGEGHFYFGVFAKAYGGEDPPVQRVVGGLSTKWQRRQGSMRSKDAFARITGPATPKDVALLPFRKVVCP